MEKIQTSNPQSAGEQIPTRQPEVVVDGYEPLQVEWREGRMYRADGIEVVPNIPVGKEVYHHKLFIEYERTFGRGNAKFITHMYLYEDYHPQLIELYGAGFLDEYRDLRDRYTGMTYAAEPEVNKYIEELNQYRKRHSRLYTEK